MSAGVLAVMDRSADEINNLVGSNAQRARMLGHEYDTAKHHAHADHLREARATVAEYERLLGVAAGALWLFQQHDLSKEITNLLARAAGGQQA